MKWLKILICISLWVLFIPKSGQQAIAQDLTLRVKLENYIGDRSSLTIKLKGNYQVKNGPSLLPDTIYSVRVENGALAIYQGNQLIGTSGESFTLTPSFYGTQNYITIQDRNYLGEMQFTIEKNQFVRPINHLLLEDYLKGVVPHEMPSYWPIEALKAQTVAARTYAMKRAGSMINDTIQYQVYGGYHWWPSTTRAVEETTGQVLRYQGRLIDAVYSSSNGGMMESNHQVWGGTPLFYLPAKDDPYDPRIPWSTSLNRVQMDLTGKDLRKPEQWWANVKESNVDVTRNMKNWLYQNGYSNTEIKVVTIPLFTISEERTTGGRSSKGSMMVEFMVKDSQGYRRNANGEILIFQKQWDHVSLSLFRSFFGVNVWKSYLIDALVNQGTEYTLSGRGYGHGVGMSQYGAKAIADAGGNYESILQFYYPGTVLSNRVHFNPDRNEDQVVDIRDVVKTSKSNWLELGKVIPSYGTQVR